MSGSLNGHRPGPSWPAETLLGRVRPESRRAMLELGTAVTFPPNRVILRQGDRDRHVYLLLSGVVKVTRVDGDQDALLAIRVAGDMVGEMAALEDKPRSASVVTSVGTEARVVSMAELTALVNERPDVALEIMRMISERLRWATCRRVDITTQPAPVRLSRILLEIARVYGYRTAAGWSLGVPLRQSELASLAGVALRTAEKILHELGDEGVISRGYRRLMITDLDALRRAADLVEDIPY